MDLLLDLLQGLGIAAAIGVRPFLPVLLVGALAAADLGVDFDGTDFSFLEAWPFLLGILVALAVFELVTRRGASLVWALLAVALALGALEAAGSLADRDHPVVIGVVGGLLAAALGFYAARALLARVRRRLDAGAQSTLPIFAEGAAALAAGASVLFPPLAVVVIAALAWLLAGSRRREGEKYAGLRILR
jgi:hypothetical protein